MARTRVIGRWDPVGIEGYVEAPYPSGREDTSGLQRLVDALPNTGGTVQLQSGTYSVAGLRLDGSLGTKSNVILAGVGWSTILKKPADSVLLTTAKKRANVVEALAGSGFVVRDLRIEGNRSRGGVSPPYGAIWAVSTAYLAVSTTTYTTKADGTAYTSGDKSVLAFANGGRMFRVAADHTSDAADVDNDVPAKMTEVTSQQWDEVAKTGYLGHYDDDNDYQYRHGVYIHGTSVSNKDSKVINVEATDCVYGGIVSGSGPLFASGVGAGADRFTTQNCYSHDNGGSNYGGGHSRFTRHRDFRSSGGHSSGARFDEGCDDSHMDGTVEDDGHTLVNGGVLIYKSDRCDADVKVRGAALSVWVQDSLDFQPPSMFDVDGLVTIANSTIAGEVTDVDNHTMVATDRVVNYTGAGGHTITLLNAVGKRGLRQTIKHKGTYTSAPLTVDATSLGQIFDDALVDTRKLFPGDTLDIESDGTSWVVVGGSRTQSGEYTPATLGNGILNIAALTYGLSYFRRHRDQVEVWGAASPDPTAAGATQFTIPLPIASDLALTTDLFGICVGAVSTLVPVISAATTANKALIAFTAPDGAVQAMTYHFYYKIK